jgi:hypothetical protein
MNMTYPCARNDKLAITQNMVITGNPLKKDNLNSLDSYSYMTDALGTLRKK